MDRELSIRKAYYQALNGHLSSNSVNIPVTDGQIDQAQPDNLYVVFDNQNTNISLTGAANMQNFISTITLGIVSKQSFSVAKSILDNVGEQIEHIITPSAGFSSLVSPTGWQINCVYLRTAGYMEVKIDKTTTIAVKLLMFEQKIVKQ